MAPGIPMSKGELEQRLAAHIKAGQWAEAGHVANALGRFEDAAKSFVKARLPYEAAVCFQKAGQPRSCLDALLQVTPASQRYRAACVQATRVAVTLGEPLIARLSPLIGSFLQCVPATGPEAVALNELARALADGERLQQARGIYERVLQAYPNDDDAREGLAQLPPAEELELSATSAPPPRPSASGGRRKRFTDLLIERGHLTALQLQNILHQHKALEGNDVLLSEALVTEGIASELDVLKALSEQTGIAYISGARILATATPQAAASLPVEKAELWKVLPVALIDRRLYVAMRDPRDMALIDKIRFVAGVIQVQGVFASESGIRKGIRKQYYGEDQPAGGEEWKLWGTGEGSVEVTRFSDRVTGTREHEFDTSEMMITEQQVKSLASGHLPPPVPDAPAPERQSSGTLPMGPDGPSHDSLSVGTVIGGRYRIEALLGRGGSATVYQAEDRELGESVAIKVFNASVEAETQLARFKLELSLSRQLIHPNIIRLYDLGSIDGLRYLTMELLDGGDLGSRLEQLGGPLPIVEGLGYLEQACLGLQAAHDVGVIHRDVKPENLFVTKGGAVKVMDFGIAKKEGLQGITVAGMIGGTPQYMSPEQINGFSTVTHLTDLYALGCSAYALFTGAPPFNSPQLMPMLMAHVNKPPVPPRERNPNIPKALEAAILKLLEKDGAKRFQSCNELRAELARIREAVAVLG